MVRLIELTLWMVLILWLCVVWWRITHTAWQASETERRKRRLKARSPEDCPACQAKQGPRGVNSRPNRDVCDGWTVIHLIDGSVYSNNCCFVS